MTLEQFLPEFSVELAQALVAAGEHRIAEQVPQAEVWACSYDPECGAGYIRVEAGRSLNMVETNVIGEKLARTVGVKHRFQACVNVDNFERLPGIELLNASSLAPQLSTFQRSA